MNNRIRNQESGIRNHARKSNGFTLVELVVSMAILSVMAAITIVSLSGTKTKQEVEGAARQVAAAIREAQNYALTGKNIGASGDVPCQFRVNVNTGVSTSNLTVQQIKFASGACNTNSGAPLTYSLSNGVQFSANADVRFDVPRGESKNSAGTDLVGASPMVSGTNYIDFSFAKNGSTAHVCVYPLGRIEEKPVGITGSEPQCI